jgi:hypothetical protein
MKTKTSEKGVLHSLSVRQFCQDLLFTNLKSLLEAVRPINRLSPDKKMRKVVGLEKHPRL